jgi:hypothetical protein
MIFGVIEIDPVARVIHTHRDSYLFDGLSVVSVRRPFLACGVLAVSGLGGFGLVFRDLLLPAEVMLTIGFGIVALILGFGVGQLQLLSRDLRGSELSGVVWGGYAALNRRRLAIAHAIRTPANTDPATDAVPSTSPKFRNARRVP